MATLNNESLVKFGYAINKDASTAAGFITFDSGKQAIYVGDGSDAKLVTSNVKDATFVESVLTVTKIDGTSFALNFSDIASAKQTMAVFTALESRLTNLDSSVSGLNTSLGALAEEVNLMDTSIRADFAEADASLADRIEKLENDDSVDGKVAKVEGAVENNVVIFAANSEVKDSGIKVGTEELTGKELANASTLATEKAVRDAIDAVSAGAAVTLSQDSSLVYTITQGGKTVGTIDIPKDMVVSSGEVVELEANGAGEGKPAGTYIKLVLANAEEGKNELYINVSNLIEYVTSGSTAGDMVYVTVDASTHKVTATITDGTVTKTKLAKEVQDSLDNADSAVQSVTAGTDDGTIAVDGSTVAVTGLKSAAYKDEDYFATPDAVGEALDDAKEYADQIKVNGKSQDSSQAITIAGTDISVGGNGAHKDSTVADAIAALDASVRAAINAAGVTSFNVNADSSNYADVNANVGAISFEVKTLDVSVASNTSTGLADAYEVKQYVNYTKTVIEGTDGDASTAATIAGAKAYADAQITANALKWTVL